MTKFIASIAAVAALTIAAPAFAVSIENGSFENPGSAGNFSTLGNGSTTIVGWTVGGSGVDYINNYWTASDGVASLDLSAGNAGSVTQTLSGLNIGQSYEIIFDMSGNPASGDDEKTMRVSVDAAFEDFDYDTATEGTTLGDMQWATMSFVFTALDTSADLTFASLETNAWGPALDNVSIGEVPIPASLLLLLGGLGAIGAVRRKA